MAEQVSKRSVFISYSRKDIEFVRKLNDSLDSSEIEAWVDWEGIPPSSDWMDEIKRAVEGADAFLFVISPDSLATVSRKVVQFWDVPTLPLVPTSELIEEACLHLTANISQSEWENIFPGEEYRPLCPNLRTPNQ